MNLDRNKAIIVMFDVAIRLDAEELLKQTNYLGVFFIDGLGIMAGNLNGGGGNRRDLAVPRGEAEAREGLLTTAGGFVENGAVNFGDCCIVVTAAMNVARGAKGERVEFGLREEAEVDEWDRVDVHKVVVGRGIHSGHGIAIRLRLCEFGRDRNW